MYQAYTGRQLREGILFLISFLSAYPDVLFPGKLRDQLALAHKALGTRPSKELVLDVLDHPALLESVSPNFD